MIYMYDIKNKSKSIYIPLRRLFRNETKIRNKAKSLVRKDTEPTTVILSKITNKCVITI